MSSCIWGLLITDIYLLPYSLGITLYFCILQDRTSEWVMTLGHRVAWDLKDVNLWPCCAMYLFLSLLQNSHHGQVVMAAGSLSLIDRPWMRACQSARSWQSVAFRWEMSRYQLLTHFTLTFPRMKVASWTAISLLN